MSETRYELLRRTPVSAKNIHAIGHVSVGGAIMEHLFDAEAIARARQTFIPPWYETVHLADIQLGYGSLTMDGKEQHEYIVERVIHIDGWQTRAMYLDGKGHPIREDYQVLDRLKTLQEAISARDELLKMEEWSQYFIDIFPDTNL